MLGLTTVPFDTLLAATRQAREQTSSLSPRATPSPSHQQRSNPRSACSNDRRPRPRAAPRLWEGMGEGGNKTRETLQEREVRYQAARDRIFQGDEAVVKNWMSGTYEAVNIGVLEERIDVGGKLPARRSHEDIAREVEKSLDRVLNKIARQYSVC
jgi:hypothetical protein